MKKKFLSLLVLPAMLFGVVSCGSSATAETDLPNAGTAVEEAEGKEALKSALSKSVALNDTTNAIAVEMSGGYLDASFSTSTTYGSATTTISANAHVKDAYLKVAAAGFTSDKVSDVKSSVKLGANINAEVVLPTGLVDSSQDTTFSKSLAAEAYLDNGTGYINLSDDLSELVSTFVQSGTTLPTKFKITDTLKAEALPLLTEETYTEAFNSISSTVESLLEGVGASWLNHGDNVYSLTLAVSGENLRTALSSALSSNDQIASYAQLAAGVLETIDDNDFIKLAAIFDTEKGLKSIGFNAGIDASSSTSQAVSGMTVASSMSLSLKAGFKFNFYSGTDAKVDSVSNPESYTEIDLGLTA